MNDANRRRGGIAAAVLLLLLGVACRETIKYPWIIVPGVRVGPIPVDVSEKDLIRRFGGEAQALPVAVGEGDYRPGMVLFPHDLRRRIEIAWRDTVAHRELRTVRFEGSESIWRLEGRVQLGTDLFELERLNGAPFTLAGFGSDEEGVVLSWEGGALAEGMKDVHLYLAPDFKQFGSEMYRRVAGNRAFSSQDGDMRLLNPKATRIVVIFDVVAQR